jgi:hypothetical protein
VCSSDLDDAKFLEIIRQLKDKSFWLSVTTRDLYYWINVLNKVDTLLESTLTQIKDLTSGKNRVPVEEFEEKMKAKLQDLEDMLTFTINLLREAGSRSIYNSVDRLIDILKEVDDLNVIYLVIETVYVLIRKSYFSGKFTKAHETENNEMLKLILMWALGFDHLSDRKVGLMKSMEASEVIDAKEIKLQRYKKIKKGNREIPSLSYLNISYKEFEISEDFPKTSKNLANHFEQKHKLGEGMVQPLAMKILIAKKIRDPVKGYENLVTINKIILKAKSTFIHLSTAEEKDQFFTQKFIKEHQFNEFIPDIIQFCTMDVPSVLHTTVMEIIHSYLCASLTQTEGYNIYRQSVTQILTSLGVMNMSNKPIHKILSDCASLHLKEVDSGFADETAEDMELACNAKFIPEATAKDPNFIDMFLEVVYTIMTNFKNVSRGNISELLKLLDALPRNGLYVFKLNQVAKATRILYSILKNNFEEFGAVDRTITRLIAEIKLVMKSEDKNGTDLDKWVYVQCPEEPVHKSQRQELVRVLFRLLNSSIFKDDPSQGNFVSNSRKILYSELFPTCLELFEENSEENSVTHDVVYISCMHLLALVLNDLPAQIYKA